MKRREFITPLEGAASKTNATKQKEEVPNNDGPESLPEIPPIDLWDDAVKKLIESAATSLTTRSTRCCPQRRSKGHWLIRSFNASVILTQFSIRCSRDFWRTSYP
jgi:hypothetical protein